MSVSYYKDNRKQNRHIHEGEREKNRHGKRGHVSVEKCTQGHFITLQASTVRYITVCNHRPIFPSSIVYMKLKLKITSCVRGGHRRR